MQWRMVVSVLLIEHFFEKQLCLRFKVAHNLVVVTWGNKLLELI